MSQSWPPQHAHSIPHKISVISTSGLARDMKDLGLENILKLEQGLGRRAAWRNLVEGQDERRSLSMVADPGGTSEGWEMFFKKLVRENQGGNFFCDDWMFVLDMR